MGRNKQKRKLARKNKRRQAQTKPNSATTKHRDVLSVE